MVKKIVCLVACLLLCVALSAPALAYQPAVVDDGDLFGASQIARMEELIAVLRDCYQVDAVVLTTYDAPRTSNDARLADWADVYYEKHGYGIGEDRAGILYVIDMVNRFSYISTSGVMIDYLTDARIDRCLDDAQEYLRYGRYSDAAIAVLERVTSYMEKGIAEGSFRYDEKTGKRLTGLYNTLTGMETFLAAGAGLLAAGIMVLCVRGSYGLRGKTYRYNAEKNAAITLTRDDERFLRQTVTRTRHDTGSSGHGGGGHSGGSGVHVSSGGMSHGSGGRHF